MVRAFYTIYNIICIIKRLAKVFTPIKRMPHLPACVVFVLQTLNIAILRLAEPSQAESLALMIE